ncbi:uncharacterized protein BX663DRAFT_517673 [Cokeromyces recurvatus]|uniref:uncharacterized protein n=1 Tax=Cokeromyces recurvatus TaxID=90255 RepID=UPI0022204A07|nr:uncharacterized protein BX663DRAFT_517673 [Cokeromyces recurvatus]KAI7900453.1 hypothetical protein BX663DRAFT_517673 [Cokeromyces recurvatus]
MYVFRFIYFNFNFLKAVVVLNTSKYPPTTTHPLLPSIITNSTTTDLLRTNALQQQWEKNVSRVYT